jgi:tetratricopeptide (TPR) repeat protein
MTLVSRDYELTKARLTCEDQKLYAQIAKNLYDIPQELDSIRPHLRSVESAKRLEHELEQGIDRFDEVPVEYREWIDMCVMLAYAPIPILLLQLHFKIDREAVLQGLKKLESIVWASIDYTASTFRILDFRRRLRREGFHNGARNAQMACNAVIEAINHLLTIGQSNAERISTEQVLIKHMNTCVENLTTWRTFMGSDCEWDVLAEFCERAGLYSEAAIFYGSARGQRVPNSNTRSRVSRSSLSVRSDNAYSDKWYDAESSTSTDVWDDARNSFSMDRSNFPDTTKDTRSSRLLRSEVGLIRMQIHLKQIDGLDGQCYDLLKRTESREKDTYITLRIELFRLIVHLKAAKKDWPEAVEGGHKLLDILHRYYGPFAEETTEAIYQLAKIHMEQEDYAGAEPLLEQVLMIQQQSSEEDENYARMIDIYRDLGRTYKEQGKVIPARECYSWVVKTYRRLLGDDHIQTTRAKESLTVIEDMMKRGTRGI